MRPSIIKAHERYQKAAENLMKEVRREYPLGTTVRARLGVAVVTIQIDGYSNNWWYNPAGLRGTNIKTGKRREFAPSDIVEGP